MASSYGMEVKEENKIIFETSNSDQAGKQNLNDMDQNDNGSAQPLNAVS